MADPRDACGLGRSRKAVEEKRRELLTFLADDVLARPDDEGDVFAKYWRWHRRSPYEPPGCIAGVLPGHFLSTDLPT